MTALTKALVFPEDKKDSSIKMSEGRFWEIVDSVDWANACNVPHSYNDIQKKLGEELSFKEIQDLRAIFAIAWNLLDKSIGSDQNPAGGSDDSHGDLISHIIGLGKVHFELCLSDYNEIANQQYVESFSYCLPYEADYKHKEDELFEFEVIMQATITKKIKVRAINVDEAIISAHDLFSSESDGTEEKYDETWLDCQKVKKEVDESE